MSKSELVEKLANEANVTKVDAEKVLKAFVSVVTKEVKQGNKVAISGLGSFESVHRAARTGINPATGAKLQIQARDAPKFKPSKSFKDLLA